MRSWVAYWGANTPFVSERHRAVHYRRIADDLLAALPPPPSRVLDFGCGEAMSTPLLTAAGHQMLLYDAAAEVRERVRDRFAADPQATILDDAAWQALAAESVDAVIVNSVVQYLSREQLDALLPRLRAVLRPGGQIILADVVDPATGPLGDAWSLIRNGAQHGFLAAAVAGLARTFFSDYRRVRRNLGFTRYRAEEVLDLLAAQGFVPSRLDHNIGLSAHRMSFRGVKPRGSAG